MNQENRKKRDKIASEMEKCLLSIDQEAKIISEKLRIFEAVCNYLPMVIWDVNPDLIILHVDGKLKKQFLLGKALDGNLSLEGLYQYVPEEMQQECDKSVRYHKQALNGEVVEYIADHGGGVKYKKILMPKIEKNVIVGVIGVAIMIEDGVTDTTTD